MTFNKPNGKHLLTTTNIESWLQSKKIYICNWRTFWITVENIKNFFLIIVCANEIVLEKAVITENMIIYFKKQLLITEIFIGGRNILKSIVQ